MRSYKSIERDVIDSISSFSEIELKETQVSYFFINHKLTVDVHIALRNGEVGNQEFLKKLKEKIETVKDINRADVYFTYVNK